LNGFRKKTLGVADMQQRRRRLIDGWRGAALAAAAMTCLASALAPASCTPESARPAPLSGDVFPQAQGCSQCHVEVYREWAGSTHAQAYSNPAFRAATDNYRFSKCLSCHAPEAALSDSEPKARTVMLDEGVTCASCHLEESRLAGPLASEAGKMAPHPVATAPDRFQSSQFCARCHIGTFREWQSNPAPDKRSCAQCHMPLVTRRITQPTGPMAAIIESMEKEGPERRHTFNLPPVDPQSPAVTFTATRTKDGTDLVAVNRLSHAVPTGDFGLRIVVLEVTVIRTDGRTSAFPPLELVKELGTGLPPHGSRTFSLKTPDDTRALRVRLVRKGQGGAADIVLAESEVPRP
jgi:nitrate/TMAO reductase-like tetraheme cytochrome c subunit